MDKTIHSISIMSISGGCSDLNIIGTVMQVYMDYLGQVSNGNDINGRMTQESACTKQNTLRLN